MNELKICDLTDLEAAAPRRIEIEGKKLSIVLLNERIYALDDTCSHEDVSLSEGEVDIDECALEWWNHGSLFSLETGEALSLPATKSVKTYEVRIVDNDVGLVIE